MNDGGPTLELVVTVAVKQIGDSDGGRGAGGFDGCESRVIVDDVVGEEDFLAAATTHVQSGKIVQRAGSGYAGEKPIVGFVPKPVLVALCSGLPGGPNCGRSDGGFGIFRRGSFLSAERWRADRAGG